MENNFNQILNKLKEYENLLSFDEGDNVDENLATEINATLEELNKEIMLAQQEELSKISVSFINKSTNEDPKFAYEGDSGFDLRADIEEPIVLAPFKRILVPTGLYFELVKGLEIQVRPRSGLAVKHGITVLNTPGTVDSHYRGEVKVPLINLGEEPFTINKGDRIAQAVIVPVYGEGKVILNKTNNINETSRGDGGFNSSGIKWYLYENKRNLKIKNLIKSRGKTATVEVRKTPHKERIRELVKKPKEKFLTQSQEEYWKILGENQITLCFGPAGVGKSYIAMKRAIDLLWEEDNKYEKIIIVRPAVEAEEKLGSLPGGLEEKLDPYIYPSYYLLNKIIGKDAREKLKDEGYIEVAALAYMRGWNVDNTILVFEEAQNASPAQIKLLLTRIGFNSKFFLSGDLEQSDKFKDKTKSGLYDAKKRLEGVKGIGVFEFDSKDIVRNPIISEILERYE